MALLRSAGMCLAGAINIGLLRSAWGMSRWGYKHRTPTDRVGCGSAVLSHSDGALGVHMAGCVTNAGIGVNTLAAGTHNTGHGALRITLSISDPKTGVPPNNEL